jgi:hypothetical protein
MLRSWLVLIPLAFCLLACDGSSTVDDYCPDFSQEIDDTRSIDQPPDLEAEAGGDSVQLSTGPSEWCHVVSDQFDVVTRDDRLTVEAGDRVSIRNPEQGGLVSSSIVIQGPQGEPETREGGYLVWPAAGWVGGGPTDIENSLEFDAPAESGVFIVIVNLKYEEVGTPDFAADRDAFYAFVLEVDDDD